MLRATGIDIGSTGTRRVSVGRFYGKVQAESSTPLGDLVIAPLGAANLTFRRLSIPHASRDTQEQIVREELAYSLPFSLDRTAWDWVEADDMASVIVAFNSDIVALREKVGNQAVIDCEPLALTRAANEARQGNVLIIDFGAQHTTVCAVKDKALEWFKASLRGGRDLTKRLAVEHGFDEQQAEEHKCAVGCEDPVCQRWLRELVDSLALATRPDFDKILLCGGGAALPGLAEQLSEICSKPALPFPLPGKLSPYTDAIAYGAALSYRPRRGRIQLCPTEPQSSNIKLIYAVWIAVLLVMGTADLELRHSTLAHIQQQHQTVISQALEEQAPEFKDIPAAELTAEVEKRLSKAQAVSLRSPGNYEATMGALGKALSSSTNMEVRTIDFHPDNSGEHTVVSLTGLAESAAQVESFRSTCDKVLTKAELIDNRVGANNTTRFTIEGQLRQQ